MNYKVIISYFFFTIFTITCEEIQRDSGKIVGGQIVEIESVPYLASFQYQNEHVCGAAIIHRQWLLSAAHCLNDWNWGDYKIRVGSTRTSRQGTLFDVDFMVPHPDYNQDTNNFDFLLIKLKKSISFNDRQEAIALPRQEQLIGENTKVLVSGFGETQNDNEQSEYLRAVVLNTINFNTCNEAYENTLTTNMVCAGTTDGGQDSCQVRSVLQIFLSIIYFFHF